MAHLRSYTSLEQSKVLAEILPLESADMYYHKNTKGEFVEYPHFNEEYKSMVDRNINYNDEVVPCWSLAALLGVLPTIDDEFEPQLRRFAYQYHCTYEGEEDSSGLWRVGDNPVDACYEWVVKLFHHLF